MPDAQRKERLTPLRDLISLRRKRALITGSARGIGKAIAHRFAEAGADLELVDIDGERLNGLKEELSPYGVDITINRVDVSEKKEVDDLWETLSNNGFKTALQWGWEKTAERHVKMYNLLLHQRGNVSSNSVF